MIYKAVIDHTIRPEVIRFDKGAGIATPTILVLDRTLATCRPDRPSVPHLGCLDMKSVQYFGTGYPDRKMIFVDLIDPEARQGMAKSLSARNKENNAFPSLKVDDLLLIDPGQLLQTLRRVPAPSRGFSRFSRPGYSGRGQALIYASYTCGGLCGYGWFFLLDQRAGAWRVRAAHMLWIS